MALRRIDGHALLVNQKALDLAGITENTEVDRGEIVKKGKNLTGVLTLYAQLVSQILPKPTVRRKKSTALKKLRKLLC